MFDNLTTGQIWVGTAILVLFLLSIVLAVIESALVQISPTKATAMAETHGERGERVRRISANPEHYLNSILLLALATQFVEATLVSWLASEFTNGWGIALVTALNIAILFVFAEAVPKTWSIQNPERAALLSAPVTIAIGAIAPLRWVSTGLIGLANVVAPGKGLQQGPWVTEAEILALADVAVEESVLHGDERDLIESIIDFGDTIAREIMVPRTDMVVFADDFEVGTCVEVAILGGLSRFPVYRDNIDNVVGVVYTKDLLRAERDDRHGAKVAEYMREPFFVPETKKVSELLREMQAQQTHMAIVIDEYGGTAGLATLEDLLEELVGEIMDEFDTDAQSVESHESGEYLVTDPTINVEDVNDEFGLALPNGEWDSVGGLVFSSLGRVPEVGDVVAVDQYELVVEAVDGKRVSRVRIIPVVDGAEEV